MSAKQKPGIRVIIVDDEKPARDLLREYLSASTEVEILEECANGFEAVKAVNEHRPDLIFLDIQMPKLDGFEVLELLGDEVPVVFVTAYDEYALRAFEVHAVDYLLKPFGPERLAKALELARGRLGHKPATPASEIAATARPEARLLERILIRDGARVHVLPAEKIDYIEAQDDYAAFKSEGKEYLKKQTLADLEKRLDPARFIRIHRSYILNVERLSRLDLYAKDSRIAILTNGAKLPVSRSGYDRLKPLL